MRNGSSPSIGLVIITDKLDEGNAAFTAVQNFCRIYEDVAESISILGPEEMSINENQVNLYGVDHHNWNTPLLEIVGHLLFQFRLGYEILKKRDELDVVFFHLGGTILVIPLLISRIFGQKPIIIVTGSVKQSYIEHQRETLTTRCVAMFIDALESISSQLASRVVFLSESMKTELNMEDSKKAITANLNYIDTDTFGNQVPESHREFNFIFVGRFEQVKGIVKFIQSISILIQNHPNIQIVVVGDGSLRSDVERIIKKNGIEDNVKVMEWVEHERVLESLRNAKYLVMPSESEGVPKTLLEAMACGTVPIATKVGGIPDIINHGENGFLLTSNEPAAMSEQILNYTEEAEWQVLSAQAREYIRSEHSFTKRRENYAELLWNIRS